MTTIPIGQKTMAASIPVVIASDQSPIPTTGSIAGTKTPANGVANPTDCIDTESFGMVWNGVTWDRTPGSTTGAVVKGATTPAQGSATPTTAVPAASYGLCFDGTNWEFAKGTTLGVGYQTMGLPDVASSAQDATPNVPNTTQAFFAKASPGNLLGFSASNADASSPGTGLYFCIVNKTSAPTGAEVPLWSVWVPPNGSVSLMWPRHLKCSIGIAGAWSTTAASVTLASITGSASILYN